MMRILLCFDGLVLCYCESTWAGCFVRREGPNYVHTDAMYLCYVNDELVFLYITLQWETPDENVDIPFSFHVCRVYIMLHYVIFVTEPMTVRYARLRFKVCRKFWIYGRPHRFLLGEALRASLTLQHSEERRSVAVV